MASSEVQAWIRRLPEPHSEGLSPPSIVYPESSYSSRTTRKLQDVVSSLPSPTPSPDIDGTSSTPRRRRLEENAATVRKRPRYEDQRTSDRRGIALPAKSSASPGRSRPKSSSARRSRGLNGARSNKTTISVSSSTMAQTASPPCEPRMSASSIEIGRGTRTARPSSAVETRSPGWSWLNPIDISSIPSSTSVWTSSSFARHRAPQQQQQRGESQDMSRVGVATSTITSSSLISNPSPLPSSPCLQQQRQRQRQPLQTRVARQGQRRPEPRAYRPRTATLSSPMLSVPDDDDDAALGWPQETTGEEANVTPPPNGEEAEVMPGRIVTSIEVEPFQEARPREVAQPRRREASGAKQQPMLATATTDPDQAQQDGEHREERPDASLRRRLTGQGRCSFNDKHLDLLSSDDLSHLRRRLRHRQGQSEIREPEQVEHGVPSSGLRTASARPYTPPPNYIQQSIETSSVSLSLGNDKQQTLFFTPSLNTHLQPVTFDDADTNTVAALCSWNTADGRCQSTVNRQGSSSNEAYTNDTDQNNFTTFMDRILSLSVNRGILPQEMAHELQAETRHRLLSPEDQDSFMLGRSSRLGFRPNTAFRLDVVDDAPEEAGRHSSGPSSLLINARHLLADSGPQAALMFELRFEFESLQGILRASRQLFGASLDDLGGRGNSSSQYTEDWAANVHLPLLNLATRYAATSAAKASRKGKEVEGSRNKVGRTSVHVSKSAMMQLLSASTANQRRGETCKLAGAYACVVASQPHSKFDRKLRDALGELDYGCHKTTEHRRRVDGAHHRRAGINHSSTNPTIGGVPIRRLPIGAVFLELQPGRCHPQCLRSSGPSSPSSPASRCCLDARARLAFWASAWYGRLSEFACLQRQHHDDDAAAAAQLLGTSPSGTGATSRGTLPKTLASRLIPLPMVAMDGVNWYLLFVVPDGSSQLAGDTSDELTKSRGVKLTQPMRIGSTDSLVEIYKLLAILREIVNWVGRDFRSWFEGLL
ncbi:hypothetical protein JX266_003957 [Neoarthrinium moseri]|nr:hypothetical protein JX266_003957 [Neoarthrinium moseri]